MPEQHSHDHPTDSDLDAYVLSEGQILEIALRELLLEKGIITQPELNEQMNITASQSASFGASIIAKAWKDREFKQALLYNPKAAITDLGYDVSKMPDLVIVENKIKYTMSLSAHCAHVIHDICSVPRPSGIGAPLIERV